MKMTNLGTKTLKNSKEFSSKNATYLSRGAFIDMTMAGAYTFLPLGLRVLNKIENIIRKEMDTIGTELLMSALSPQHLWEQTGRINTVDVLMKTSGANEASKKKSTNEYILNSTQEELITPIAAKFNKSYRDFPFAFYQIQTKFRNEARAKSGILRGREFRMKDLYSFHTSEEDLKKYYDHSKTVYTKVFENLGLGEFTYMALASGGDFTKDYSHEFQTKCASGEDTIFYDKELKIAYNKEVSPSKAETYPQDTEMKELSDVFGENIKGMKELAEFLKLPYHKCVKTMIYEIDNGKIIAAAVRGDYKINEYKLKKVLGSNTLALASEEVIKKVTNAEIGYAGIIGLPETIQVIIDDSVENLINFECGANKTNYHTVNVNWGRDINKPDKFFDIKEAKDGDYNPESNSKFEVFAACEVGNIFPLNTKFSNAFGYTFTDKNEQKKPVYMGCYGIGPSRIMGVLVEMFNDEKGIIWPEQVAPFKVHLIDIKSSDNLAEKIYNQLQELNIEVLFDDRDISTGEKFADADLIGNPIRLVVSDRNNGKIEWKNRNSNESELLEIDELIKKLTS
ncbi:proline--tRNA ligase [Candidatus Woesebacteria bacterium]|nr:proline--tRNA ligase [Candidatus Woesebacteria bacterium]